VARLAKPLTARHVTTHTAGVYGDGNGLFLVVKGSGARSWEVRYQLPGAKRRTIGLGAVDRPHSLAEAREQARLIQKKAKSGVDPLDERDAIRSEAIAAKEVAKTDAITFRDCAEEFIASRKNTWKSARHAAQWPASLNRHAYPVLSDMPVKDITVTNVLEVLQPIWITTPETANRVRNRIELVLDWAECMDYRPSGNNPASWRHSKLKMLLPPLAKTAEMARRAAGRPDHYPALPWQDMPAFMDALRAKPFMGARALAFTILTAGRSNQTIGACWDEFDLNNRIWTVPAIRMKGGRDHRVPLCDTAMAIMAIQRNYRKYSNSNFVFPGANTTQPMYRTTMHELLKSINDKVTIHGFRSTFRQWAADTNRSHEAAEMALAHALSKVERAYQRSDLLEERRLLMKAWDGYIAGSTVIAFPARQG